MALLFFVVSHSAMDSCIIPQKELKFTHPFLIFDVNFSSFRDKAFHCVVMAFFCCSMQRSPLIKRANFKKVIIMIQLLETDYHCVV